MTGKVMELHNVLQPDMLATRITEKWTEYETLRNVAKTNWEEIRRYVYATSTDYTTSGMLPWKNRTTIPKLCQIRDNLYANYTATLFPQRKWLIWEGDDKESDTIDKKNAIANYMSWAVSQPAFKHELDKIILDYIDFGNCFATVEWVDQRIEQPGETMSHGPIGPEAVVQVDPYDKGRIQTGYVGPMLRRISPLDMCMNPTAENFLESPKMVRSIISMGELRSLLQRMSTDENREEYEALFEYLKNIRYHARTFQGDWIQRDHLYSMDGFSSFRAYLLSDFVEVLTFYGDFYDYVNDIYEKNRVITVVDRHRLIGNKPNPSYFGYPPIFHVPWRKKQDNLWGMGPLDNLVGMQYRLDHIENMRADIVDVVTYPVQMIQGFVEEFVWQPGEKIFTTDEGTVSLVSPEVSVLNANFELQQLAQLMEEMAGAPKEAMGFRTPGEKTKYEVQSLENAAARVFQNKIKQFEEQMVEPLLNAMLELARRNLTGATTIKVLDDNGLQAFETLTPQDITGVGRIKPVAARHFAEQSMLVQNLTQMSGSPLWQLIQPHVSGKHLAKAFENIFSMEDYQLIYPYIGIAEQAEAQKFVNALQQQIQVESQVPTGRGADYDPGAMQQAMTQHAQRMDQAPQNRQGAGPVPGVRR